MKLRVLILAAFLLASPQTPAQIDVGLTVPECRPVIAACSAAGYKVGAHKKGDKEGADTGVWVDCIDAVADGKKKVPGVDPIKARACKDAKKNYRLAK